MPYLIGYVVIAILVSLFAPIRVSNSAQDFAALEAGALPTGMRQAKPVTRVFVGLCWPVIAGLWIVVGALRWMR